MSIQELIRKKVRDASATTLGDVCDVDRIADHGALAALATSRIVACLLEDAQISLETLPLPPISGQFEMQLEVLWRRYNSPGADREAIAGAIERIAAELYGLTLAELMSFEVATSAGRDGLAPK